MSQASSIKVLSEDVGGGVAERRFDIVVNGETVPGIIWAPENAAGTRPLLLMGHGGTQHKRIDTMVSRAAPSSATMPTPWSRSTPPGTGNASRRKSG